MRRELLAISPVEVLRLIVVSLVVAVALGTLYAAARSWVQPAWLAAALVHTGLAIPVLMVLARRGALKGALGLGPWQAYIPTAVIVLGVVFLTAGSRLFAGPAESISIDIEPAWILWVPLVEEIVFRVGIGSSLRRLGSPLWAIWFSALVFAMAHGAPTLSRLAAGEVGVPLGPFLLGLLCEALYLKTGRLLPIVALHAACNATPLLFALLDARWLEWLGFLYQ